MNTEWARSTKSAFLGFTLGMMVMFAPHGTSAATVDMGVAGDFAVLAGAGITITGPTTIRGDIGTFPTLSMTGLENLILDGVNQVGNAITQAAQLDLTTAYNDAAGRALDVNYGGGTDLGGLTLSPGVYHSDTSLFLTGTLTLDAQSDPNALWIFQMGSTLITATGSDVALINGAQAGNIFWQVGSSATLGTGTDFAGNILALESITLTTGATVEGRVLASTGAVTMDSNDVTIPEAGTLQLLGIGAAALLALKRRFLPKI